MQKKLHNKKVYSSFSIALNLVIITALSVIVILLCMYLIKYINGGNTTESGGDDIHIVTSQSEETEIITAEIFVTTPFTTITETTIQVPETSVTETAIPVALPDNYDKDFFASSLFIGDSIATGLSGFGYLPAENVFAQVGLNPNSVLTHLVPDVTVPEKTEKTAVEKANELQPEYIFIMLGTNGLAYLDIDFMIEKMSLFIDSLREVSPNSEIVVISIPPVTAVHEAENPEKIKDIENYNNKLNILADNKDCHFIDIYTMLLDETGYFSKDYAENDGLHFKGRTYPVVLSKIQYDLSEEALPVSEIVNDNTIITEIGTTTLFYN